MSQIDAPLQGMCSSSLKLMPTQGDRDSPCLNPQDELLNQGSNPPKSSSSSSSSSEMSSFTPC
uniref:Uncharacterized protein n=1 Tax=Arundo donax TaxID=35708 RepID=A0A0A9U7U5_ARUDO